MNDVYTWRTNDFVQERKDHPESGSHIVSQLHTYIVSQAPHPIFQSVRTQEDCNLQNVDVNEIGVE